MVGGIVNSNKKITPNSLFVEKLKKALPECFDNEENFNTAKFNDLLNKNKVNVTNENFHLKFLGESYAHYISSINTETVIRETDESLNIKSENAYIIGDNLDALKHLRKAYSRKVNFIYIDPPYNTGNDGDFVYNDKFILTREDLINKFCTSEKEADLILNLEGKSSHSAWCTFMYPRLRLAHDLLSDDGIMFVSIDEHEFAVLKLLLDTIFGESCYIENFIWIKNSTKNLSKTTSTNHEYIFCYTKNIDLIREEEIFKNEKEGLKDVLNILKECDNLNLSEKEAEERLKKFYSQNSSITKGLSAYNRVEKRLDETSGQMRLKAYTLDNASAPMSSGKGATYTILHPITGRPCVCPSSGWRYTRASMEEHVKNNLIYFYEDETHVPRFKRFLDTTTNTIMKSSFENFQDGKKDLMRLFDGNAPFDNAKPVSLIKKFLEILKSESLVLDFFSGSATTADAVMSYNAEHPNKHLKYIMVQLKESISSKKSAYEMGYRTIDEIGRDRIKKVKEKLISEYGDKVKDEDFDFKTFEIIEISKSTLDKIAKFDASEASLVPAPNNTFDDNTIITTYKLQDGFLLTDEARKIPLYNNEYVYSVKDSEKECVYITKELSSKSIKLLLEALENIVISPKRIVIYGYALTFHERTELEVNLKSIRRKGISENILETRY